MPRVDPVLLPALRDLDRALRELQIPFGVVGALVPELLLDVPPWRKTNDADVTVVLRTLDEFERLKDRLATYGFRRTSLPHRVLHASGGRIDILPFSDVLAPDELLRLDDDTVMNMAGFRHVVGNTVQVQIEDGPTLPLTPLPLYVLLKLIAYEDRKAARHLAAVFHCLRHYAEDDIRRYDVEHEESGVPYEYSAAFLLGGDGKRFLDPRLARDVRLVLDRFSDSYAEIVQIVSREAGRLLADDRERTEIFEFFGWYRRGLDV